MHPDNLLYRAASHELLADPEALLTTSLEWHKVATSSVEVTSNLCRIFTERAGQGRAGQGWAGLGSGDAILVRSNSSYDYSVSRCQGTHVQYIC